MPVLSMYNNNGEPVPFVVDADKAFCTHNYNGIDELEFELSEAHPAYNGIAEEMYINGFGNNFVVKSIDEHSDFAVIKCTINLEDWQQTVLENYRKTNAKITDVMEQDLLPDGWNIIYGAGVNKTVRTTVEESEDRAFGAAVPLTILDAVSSAYSVVFNFDVPNKIVRIINPNSFLPSGEFLMANLNFFDFGFNGNSDSFATRLYPYGKIDETTGKHLTIASVNGGEIYLDNNTYSDKVVCATWVDERYTIPSELKAAAQAKLDTLAIPQRSYTGNVKNLLDNIFLYKVITLVDHVRELRVDHQIITYVEYADNSLDSCTLASDAPSIQGEFQKLADSVSSNAVTKAAIAQDISSEVQRATDQITGAQGGHFKWIIDQYGNPQELVLLVDSEDINEAMLVFRYDNTGIAYSTTGYSGQYIYILKQNAEVAAGAGINVNNVFKVSATGKMEATNADVIGTLTIGGILDALGKIKIIGTDGIECGTIGVDGATAPSLHANNGYNGTIPVTGGTISIVDGIVTGFSPN